MKEKAAAAKHRFEEGAGGELWTRLNAIDFINQAFILASLLFLCVVPFLMLVAALKGADFVDNLSRRLSLNDAASQDVRTLFASSATTLASTTVLSAIGLAFWAVAVAAVIKGYYVKVFDVDPKNAKGLWRLPVWFIVVGGTSTGVAVVNRWLNDLSAGSVLAWVFGFAVSVAFWWWSMHFLVAGRRTWRYLLPSALATAVCFAGLRAFAVLALSSAVTSNENRYGPIGVVFILMYWLVSVGVVILLGAVIGVVYQERIKPDRAAARTH